MAVSSKTVSTNSSLTSERNSGLTKPTNKSEASNGTKYAALAAIAGAALIYAAAANSSTGGGGSPGGGGNPPPPDPFSPLKDLFKNRVSLPDLSTRIRGICPLADRFSPWKIMQLLNQKVTQDVGRLTVQARDTSYDTYDVAGKPSFRYGISGGVQCERRDWPKNTSKSLYHSIIEDTEPDTFRFSKRWDGTPSASYPKILLKCNVENDTLTCTGKGSHPEEAASGTNAVRSISFQYEAIEEKGGSITERVINGNDIFQEKNNAPLLLNQLLNSPLKV